MVGHKHYYCITGSIPVEAVRCSARDSVRNRCVKWPPCGCCQQATEPSWGLQEALYALVSACNSHWCHPWFCTLYPATGRRVAAVKSDGAVLGAARGCVRPGVCLRQPLLPPIVLYFVSSYITFEMTCFKEVTDQLPPAYLPCFPAPLCTLAFPYVPLLRLAPLPNCFASVITITLQV